ncbi:MAG: NAD-dependent epimerase/dehydratase family protein [Solirubrobacterales bacterium]|nr:NAD-dependent epimerase/dehydratase family protein [Solirubrobacterales bacterium]MCB8914839.1 NAD-dependent epimerase/dehydratase family protein [Thermoleophilales bacterium]
MEDNPKGARRVLVTGLSTYWGGRLAAALESNPAIEAIIGVDSNEPTRELTRTEYVRVGAEHRLIERIVQAARIDTVVDTRLMVDSVRGPDGKRPEQIHENNVIGTLNILAACSAGGSPVRKLVFKSSAHWYGCAQDDPAFFTEDMVRRYEPETKVERDVVEAEAAVAEFRAQRPAVAVSVLRFANVLGAEVDTSHVQLLGMPAVPMIAGFDPRYQFVDEIDVVHGLEHVVVRDIPGIYNVAGDGVLTLSEVISLLGKHPLPVIPPWGTSLAMAAYRRVGLTLPAEMVKQLRFGRAVDNRAFKATGFHFRYTSRETVLHLRDRLRLDPVADRKGAEYSYEPEVEDFLRHSPHVDRSRNDFGREDAALFDPSPPVQD